MLKYKIYEKNIAGFNRNSYICIVTELKTLFIMATKIALLNFKGGVGKTTTTVNLAKGFHSLGKRVLVIDADAQGNASRMMGFRQATDKGSNTLYEAMSGTVSFKSCIYIDQDNEESFDYVPSRPDLYRCEQELVSRTGREYILRMLLDEIESMYDYIFIDCPPNNGLVAVNAMCASDYLLVPINCEVFALDGMGLISAKYEEVKKLVNPKLQILGYVMSRYDKRLTLHREAYQQMESLFPGKVFNTKIRTNIQLAESPAKRTNIFDFAPSSPGAADYQALTEEILSKIENK